MIGTFQTRAILALTVLSFGAACAPARPVAPVSARPAWAVFPSLGARVPETLNGLFDRGGEDYRIALGEVTIFRTTSAPWEEIPLEDLPPAIDLASGSYAIAARRYCRTWAEEPFSVGTNEWFLFRDGRLTAYDSRVYGDQCGFAPSLEPAQGESIEAEAQLRQWMADNFSAADESRVVHYVKGIVYANADRLDAAEQYLASGDSIAPAVPGGSDTAIVPGRAASSASRSLPRAVDEIAAREILAVKIDELRREAEAP